VVLAVEQSVPCGAVSFRWEVNGVSVCVGLFYNSLIFFTQNDHCLVSFRRESCCQLLCCCLLYETLMFLVDCCLCAQIQDVCWIFGYWIGRSMWFMVGFLKHSIVTSGSINCREFFVN
jgi:hypothetical protein